jgi:OmpA-OmpF porin, OOP family
MKTLLCLTVAATTAALLTCAGHDARAQSAGFAVDRYEPAERGSDWFANESLDLRGAARPAAGVTFDWAYKPLRLYPRDDVQGLARATVITDQVFLHTGGTFVVGDWLRFGASLPIAIYQQGEDTRGIAIATSAPDKAALGDARLGADALVFGAYGGLLRGAVGARLFLPTGSRTQMTGDGTLRVAPHVLFAGDYQGFLYAAKLGLAVRPWDGTFEGRPLGSEALFSAAVGVKANDRFVLGPELHGSTQVTRDAPLRTRDTPLELLVGAHLNLGDDAQVGTAIGPGLTRGDGSPSMRVLVSFEWSPDPCVDKDGDGICAPDDACPDVDGVRTRDPKTNGCPPPATQAE